MKYYKTELKEIKKKAGVDWASVCDDLGISESKLYKMLRHKMTEETFCQIKQAIERQGVNV